MCPFPHDEDHSEMMHVYKRYNNRQQKKTVPGGAFRFCFVDLFHNVSFHFDTAKTCFDELLFGTLLLACGVSTCMSSNDDRINQF
jgi:hypothetical protein